MHARPERPGPPPDAVHQEAFFHKGDLAVVTHLRESVLSLQSADHVHSRGSECRGKWDTNHLMNLLSKLKTLTFDERSNLKDTIACVLLTFPTFFKDPGGCPCPIQLTHIPGRGRQ